MASFYTIIQFVPDPVADERINAGVIVFDRDRVRARFVENWGRLHRFGNQDVTFLKRFAKEFHERAADHFPGDKVDPKALREMASTWKSAIQFTEPRGSLLSLEALLADTEARYLAHDRPSEARPYTKHSMKKIAIEAAKLAFFQRGGSEATRYVKRDYPIAGQVEDHPFSLAIANGRPLVAAEVFSFVGADRKGQEKDVRATAWAFEDIKKRHPELALAALVIQGREPSQTFEDAEKVFGSLGVEIVPREGVTEWADEIAGRVLQGSSPR